MFSVIYRFNLRPQQEASYKKHWNTVVDHFKKECGALGSILHQGDDGMWVAYSCWPDKATRDAAWPGKEAPNKRLPQEVRVAIEKMQEIAAENQDLEQYDEIALKAVENKLFESTNNFI